MSGANESEINVSDVIENFLNGRYMEYQSQINTIIGQMKYDLYFGHRLQKVMKEIRKKALIQYVTPYKVINMREISKAFGLSLEQIESEIAELIVAKEIQSKIDSHSKLLYSRKDNETLNSYKDAVELGNKFI